jgi:hypothetical protein
MSMRKNTSRLRAISMLGLLAIATGICAQDKPPDQQPPPSKKDQAPSPANRITIEVTGGEANKPVENASVYLKTIKERLLKDKKFEVNVKTNQQGVAHIPDAPIGRVEIQIVAEGWKTFGQWYEITDPKQVIKIHLDRPPRWY